MRSSRRTWALCLPVAGFLVVEACSPAAGRPVGISGYGGSDDVGSSSSSASSGASSWAAYASSSSWPRANARRFSSQGHYFGKLDADIRVSPSAASAYARLAIGSALPPGATVMESLVARGSDTLVGVLVMERDERGWRYLDVDPSGKIRSAGSALAPCASCHAHVASQDFLFGTPESGL